jgi:hypothetical protein
MKILHWKHTPELTTIVAFLRWQRVGADLELEDQPRVMAESNGTNVAVIYDKDGVRIARGFQELIKHWDREGLWLL